jgi:glycosyltransferase domain-containing protein
MNSRSQITIICATYNRPHYIRRYIDYYSDTDVKVIIEDSSSVALKDIIMPSNIHYSWKPERSFTQKVYELIKQVKTPYIVLCSDDDFVIPDSLDTCVEWLNTHPDYSAAHGQVMRLVNKNGRNYYFPELRAEPYPGKQNINDNLVERVQHQFYPHSDSLICAVLRVENMRQAMAYCHERLIKIDIFVLVLGVVSVCVGKTIVLPILYSVLSYIPNSSGTQSEHILEFNAEKMNEAQRRDFTDAVDYAASTLSDYASMRKETAQEMIAELFYSLHHQTLHPLIQPYSESNFLKRTIRLLLPRTLYNLLGEAIKTQRLLQFLRSQSGMPYSDTTAKQGLKRISAFVEKHNSHILVKSSENKLYLAIRYILIDRYFQA